MYRLQLSHLVEAILISMIGAFENYPYFTQGNVCIGSLAIKMIQNGIFHEFSPQKGALATLLHTLSFFIM